MRTIGFYDSSPAESGTTRYLLELLSGLDRSQYRAVVFGTTPARWHDEAREWGATLVYGVNAAPSAAAPVPFPSSATAPAAKKRRNAVRRFVSWGRWIQQETAELTALFRRESVDLLHSNAAGEEVAPIAARRAGIPLVVGTLHVDPTYDLFGERRGAHHLWLERRSFRALDLAIAVSESTATTWRDRLGFGPTDRPRIAVVSNGIRLDRMVRRRPIAAAKAALGLSPESFVVGSVGRLEWAKGYIDLIASLPAIVAARPSATFVHAGHGPLAQELAAKAEQLGVVDHVRWLGFRSDVRDLLEAADLYVQPSWCESQGLAALEAGALAIPVVATQVGGLPASLDGGSAGTLVPARDPAALAQAIIALASSTDERARLGAALNERVRARFTNTRMVAETMTLYDELFATRDAASARR